MFEREEPAQDNGPRNTGQQMVDDRPEARRHERAMREAAAAKPIGGSTRGGYASGENRLSYDRETAPDLRPANFGLEGYGSQELSLDNVVDAFTYQPVHTGQIEQAEQVREILIAAAKVILRNVPRSPRRTLALQHLVNARMDANCAISFGGRF